MVGKEKFHRVIHNHSQSLKLYGVKEIGLFGSVNRGDDRNGSDYDVLVVFGKEKKNFRNFVAVSDLLEEQLGASVDMVTREGLSRHIGPYILKETEYVPIVS